MSKCRLGAISYAKLLIVITESSCFSKRKICFKTTIKISGSTIYFFLVPLLLNVNKFSELRYFSVPLEIRPQLNIRSLHAFLNTIEMSHVEIDFGCLSNRLMVDRYVLYFLLIIEAVVRRCSVKKVFLKISQNSSENTCARVSFLC